MNTVNAQKNVVVYPEDRDVARIGELEAAIARIESVGIALKALAPNENAWKNSACRKQLALVYVRLRGRLVIAKAAAEHAKSQKTNRRKKGGK